jgi:DNA replication protein DnaC
MSNLAEKLIVPAADLANVDDQPEACERCHGTGMEIVPGRGARQCECRQQQQYERFLAKANLPERYRHCTLRDYKVGNKFALSRIRQKMIEFVNHYPMVERGFLLTGTVGVGKTHLAVATLKGVMQKGATGLFYEIGALLKEIQSSYNPVSASCEYTILQPVLDAEVLVLDELGAARPTLWVQEALLHIINTRYNQKRITFFTTNYPDERTREGEETLQDRIGARLRSRLFEMCETVVIEGEDYRRKTNA